MNKIYLDQASTSFPKAPSVADAVYHYLSKAPVNVNRGTYQDAYDTEEQIFETREQLLKLFHFSSGKGKRLTKEQKSYKLAYQYLIKLIEINKKKKLVEKIEIHTLQLIKMLQQWF